LKQAEKVLKKAESDKAASSRKEDHIDLAFKSAVDNAHHDDRFYYEAMMSAHPSKDFNPCKQVFLGKKMSFPVFVSSMTGGTEKANTINHNLARVCGEFGLGMGLGSCRQLLYDDKRLADFDVRSFMPEQPLMINLGIAQIDELLSNGETERIESLRERLDADALIVHVNPLQEWLQPEGDVIARAPIDIIVDLLGQIDMPVIVKEVGQGFGKSSLERLLQLPLAAIDLAGFGGTNFSKLELLRSDEQRYESYKHFYAVGQDCHEMLAIINSYFEEHSNKIQCPRIIFSGGIKSFLDGYYLIMKSRMPSFYAQASAFLKNAMNYEDLRRYVKYQTEGLKMAYAFLKVKNQ
jgi:isopentenyl-diphosphate delta-isomerase